MWKAVKVKITLLRPFWSKSGLLRQKGQIFEHFFGKGPLSDQDLIKRTYLAVLHHLVPNTCVKAESCVFEDIEQESFLVMKLNSYCDETKKKM